MSDPINPPKVRDPSLERVKDACAKLMDHFDACQIFVSVHDAGHKKWIEVDHGEGNFLTRYGQAQQWIVFQDEITRQRARNP